MKINKILAAGVAATLAVTSLSAVASADTHSVSWKMDYTFSKIQWNNQKMYWLGDNDYIGTTAVNAQGAAMALLNTELTTGTEWIKIAAATGAGIANYKGDVNYINDAGGSVKDAAGNLAGNALATATNLSDAMKANNKKAVEAEKLALTAAKAAIDNYALQIAGTINWYTAEKMLGDAKIALDNYDVAYAAIASIYNEVDGTTDGNKAAIKAALEAILDQIKDSADEFEKVYLQAEAALKGAPLLTDTEVGGIRLSTEEIPLVATEKGNGSLWLQITGAKLVLKGTKRGSTASESWEGSFQQAYDDFNADHTGNTKAKALYLAFAPKYVNRPAFVNLGVFGTITDAELQISYKLLVNDGDATDKIFNDAMYYSEDEYDAIKKIAYSTLRAKTAMKVYDNLNAGDTETFNLEADDVKWVTSYTDLVDPTTNLYKLYKALQNSVITGDATENSNSRDTRFPFLTMTTDKEGETIVRNRAWPLSFTGAYTSRTQTNKDWVYYDGRTQTYDDFGMGTQPKWFAGLASQIADFFQKQNNGQVIFYLEDPALADKWVSYGVPSTEVGLRTLQGTAMALFFNYNQSTGSIQSIGVVDKDAWTITFDMATVLDDFGGLTKGNLSDIYYGLNTGLKYGSPYSAQGYVVNKVELKYDDAPAAVDATTDDDAAVVVADDDDDDVVADDDDDDIFADDDVIADDDDDDDDAGIIEDDDDDDTDVNNDVDYVDGADDDANPGTGVGLAVIPAIVAAAAAVVSKKRK